MPSSPYYTEAGAVNQGRSVITDPYGEWAKLKQYFGLASDVQSYYDSVSADIKDAQSQPGYKSSKELQDYVSGLMNTVKKVREQYGGSSVATPGINPNASTNASGEDLSWSDWAEDLYKDTLTGDAVKAGRKATGIPEGGIGFVDMFKNGGLIILGIVIIGGAVFMMGKKQVIAIVKSTAADIVT